MLFIFSHQFWGFRAQNECSTGHLIIYLLEFNYHVRCGSRSPPPVLLGCLALDYGIHPLLCSHCTYWSDGVSCAEADQPFLVASHSVWLSTSSCHHMPLTWDMTLASDIPVPPLVPLSPRKLRVLAFTLDSLGTSGNWRCSDHSLLRIVRKVINII